MNLELFPEVDAQQERPKTEATGFFGTVDQLCEKSRREREETFNALKAFGWILRPLSGAGMWRARRWTRAGGVQRLHATTAEGLLALARADYERRHPPSGMSMGGR